MELIRSRTTTAAGALAIAVTVPFLYSAARSAMRLADPAQAGIDSGAVVVGVPLQSYGNVLWLTVGVLVVLSALAIAIGVNILRRRAWAREGGVLLFALFSLALPIALSGLVADPPAPGAWQGTVVGIVNIVIVVLLLRRSTADDVEMAERVRQQRKDAAAAARRARTEQRRAVARR